MLLVYSFLTKKIITTKQTIDYSGQPSWALGLTCVEIATKGKQFFVNYPDNKAHNPETVNLLAQFPDEFQKFICCLLEELPEKRIDLASAKKYLEAMKTCIDSTPFQIGEEENNSNT
jgi:hypothetical protein